MVLVKPFAVLAARCLGPGRLRLELVKLSHGLADGGESTSPSGRPQAMPSYQSPTQRAA
ncbi:MAG TPA: hypothetical protein VNF91_10190 [Candidatus Acidoferrum sp.]|nr:hypothetical protein [Candidatus Acidoferrum sp.]HXJ49525.1 hypothetical protein [Candidatus Acidoferrum sp.]